MSNHAHLRPHNWRARPGGRGAIPDAYAAKPPAWRRPAKVYKPNVRQAAR